MDVEPTNGHETRNERVVSPDERPVDADGDERDAFPDEDDEDADEDAVENGGLIADDE